MAKLILPELSISVKMPFFANEGIRYDLDRSPQNKISKTSAEKSTKPKEHTFDGNNVSFEREVKSLQKNSRKGSVLRTAGNYLLKHSRSGHMNYAEAKRLKLPIGSGVIESTIRRVVNLRLKGASVYWTEPMAQDMLLLRCLYKANRWQHVEKQGITITHSTV